MGAFDFPSQSLLLDALQRPDGQYFLDRVPQAPTLNNPNPDPTPLLRDRVAIAKKVATGDGAAPAEENVVGIALWASVSDAVDAKISEQIKANVFPVRLGPEDWTSGDTVWLLDLIAADRKQATSVLANFRKVAGERPVKVAPLVARLIDPEVAERLRGADPAPVIPEPQGRA